MSAILYLGLELPEHLKSEHVIHYPIIRVVPRPREDQQIRRAFADFDLYTHIIFSSKAAAGIFFSYAADFGVGMGAIGKKHLIAVGQSTAGKIRLCGANAAYVASNETAEGIIEILEQMELSAAHFLWPRSSLSRPLLKDWMQARGIMCCDCVFYDTLKHTPLPLPDLTLCREIIFTSPSTVDAFMATFGGMPENVTPSCIGPITQQRLKAFLSPSLY